MISSRRVPLGFIRLGGALAIGLVAFAACSAPSIAPLAPATPGPESAARAAEAARPVDPARARNVFVMLSGGVSWSGNNYSQYLQAKAVATFFERNYPLDSVWTFFGAGNIEGQPQFPA